MRAVPGSYFWSLLSFLCNWQAELSVMRLFSLQVWGRYSELLFQVPFWAILCVHMSVIPWVCVGIFFFNSFLGEWRGDRLCVVIKFLHETLVIELTRLVLAWNISNLEALKQETRWNVYNIWNKRMQTQTSTSCKLWLSSYFLSSCYSCMSSRVSICSELLGKSKPEMYIAIKRKGNHEYSV